MSKHSRRQFIARSVTGLGVAAAAGAPIAAANAQAPATSSSSMPRRPLGRTGWLVSLVAFGGGSQFLSQEDNAKAEEMVHRAVALGVNYFDTAFTYLKEGKRESFRRYREYLVPKHRSAVKIASKLEARDADTAKRNFEITLKELGTDFLDVLHFHALSSKEDVDKILAADGAAKFYRKLKDEGVIKAIGISGHASGEVMMDAITRIEPDVAMFPVNPAHAGKLSGGDFLKVIGYAIEKGVGPIAMKTTARNGLIGKNGVAAAELVRYAMNTSVAAAVIGMPSMEVLESCTTIARNLQPLSDKDRKNIEERLASAGIEKSIPYLAAGYMDHCGSRLT